jgi:hypothetical protein
MNKLVDILILKRLKLKKKGKSKYQNFTPNKITRSKAKEQAFKDMFSNGINIQF